MSCRDGNMRVCILRLKTRGRERERGKSLSGEEVEGQSAICARGGRRRKGASGGENCCERGTEADIFSKA